MTAVEPAGWTGLSEAQESALAKLREPFPANQINKRPQPYKKDSPKSNCKECGGYHGMPAMHLDYVGHAALTARLLDVDPTWTWEPRGAAPDGLPAFDRLGGLWINLTVCGITRPGYGDAEGKSGAAAVKETIGDALRNAGMRFGMALELWHKGDLYEAQQAIAEDKLPDPAMDEIAKLKDSILKTGRELNLKANDLADQFAADNGGLTVSNANAGELKTFLDALTVQVAKKRAEQAEAA